MAEITYCIPSKNNLRYLKQCIASIKENSTKEYSIIVYIDSDTDGTETWLLQNNIRYIKNPESEPKGIAYAFNRCVEKSITPIVCIFHADMYMAKGFDVGILDIIKPGKVVSATRIEPPLHPEGKEKIIKNFGMYPEDFKKNEFDNYVKELCKSSSSNITHGIFAPWAIYKDDIIKIGMHDETFNTYYEDSDIFNRFILEGYECIQTWVSYVYHLTCRGGQFKDGIDKITTDPEFHRRKLNSGRNYIRKWGSWIKNDEFQHPIIIPKYDIGIVVKNCNPSILAELEIWCNNIYIDDPVLRTNYIQSEQPNTPYNLSERVLLGTDIITNDIIVGFDALYLNKENHKFIQLLQEILQDTGEIGDMEWNIFKLKIRKLRNELNKEIL